MCNIAADAKDTALKFEIPSNVQDTCGAMCSSKAGVDRFCSMRVKIPIHVLARLCAESEKNVSKKFGGIVSETFVDVETLAFRQKDLWITPWMEATSGDRAEFFFVTNNCDNTSGLKSESISPDRQRPHHFLADLKAALPNTQAFHAWWWSPCRCWLEPHSRKRRHLICGPSGPIHATQFFGAVTCVATKGTNLHLCNDMGAELFVDRRLNSSQ